MGIVFTLFVTVIFIIVRNRTEGRDELEGLLPSGPKVKNSAATMNNGGGWRIVTGLNVTVNRRICCRRRHLKMDLFS